MAKELASYKQDDIKTHNELYATRLELERINRRMLRIHDRIADRLTSDAIPECDIPLDEMGYMDAIEHIVMETAYYANELGSALVQWPGPDKTRAKHIIKQHNETLI